MKCLIENVSRIIGWVKFPFVLLSVLILFPNFAFAYDYQYNGIYYNLNADEGTAVVTNSGSYGCYSGNVAIPEYITGPKSIPYDVVAIGKDAFRNSVNLTAVTIPSTIERIEDNAFQNCI